ncbi:uncharacterized protein LOC129756837 [Uranotaenia lowii]|uniref:uncharacterized protein LOC129756837 n=1 Tax=Uranotaenia lowii TaxID=190385 RepID=UPI00247A3A96|nr:uncharacterized protein LOC129756837 [Uranotaenia lowii]
MNKIINFVLVSTLALAISFACGNADDSPLRSFSGYHQWKPMIKWRQPHPPADFGYPRNTYTDDTDYSSSSADDGSDPVLSSVQDAQPIDYRSKRSRMRQPLCEVLVNYVNVGNGTDGYQYRPDHYVTESCLNTYNTFQNKCMETGLSCTQIRQKIFITRRKVAIGEDAKSANCWEHVRMEEIDAGCECMWPREHIGDKHSYRNGK